MPQVDEIKNGREIGYKSSNRYIWCACIACGKERWVQLSGGEPSSRMCRHCCGVAMSRSGFVNGEKNPNWKGGRMETRQGYILVKLYPDDFFYQMAQNDGYVLEHRLVVAKALGRNLHSWEIVHHKHDKYPKGREDRRDNRYPENLQLVTNDRHNQITILENRISRLEDKVSEQSVIIGCLERGCDGTGWLIYGEKDDGKTSS